MVNGSSHRIEPVLTSKDRFPTESPGAFVSIIEERWRAPRRGTYGYARVGADSRSRNDNDLAGLEQGIGDILKMVWRVWGNLLRRHRAGLSLSRGARLDKLGRVRLRSQL